MPDHGKIALIIGIDQYDIGLDPLPSSKKDANDLNVVLSKLDFTSFNGSPIIGSEVAEDEMAWAKIRVTIHNFFREAKPSQILLFYFSGHGITGDNDVFLSNPQIDPKDPSSRGFSLSELSNCMGLSKSRQIIGIIDACYSGGVNLPHSGLQKKAAADNERKQALASYDKVWKKTPKTKGISLLLSSRSYEPSNAIEGDNSLYTKYLIEGILGVRSSVDQNGEIILRSGSIDEKGCVTPQSLHDYVYEKVANITDQVPELKSDQSSKIIIAYYPELSKPKSEPESEQLTKQELQDSFSNEIKQKAEQIAFACNSFYKVREALIETRKVKDEGLLEEINKTSQVLKGLYSKSERTKINSNLLTKQFENRNVDSETFEKKISILVEDMAKIEFEFKESVRYKLEKFERELDQAIKSAKPALLDDKPIESEYNEGIVLGNQVTPTVVWTILKRPFHIMSRL